MTEDNSIISYRFGTPMNDGDGTYNPISYPINNIVHTYYPYTPNFTTKKLNQVPSAYEPIHTSYSSGIDCVTIIQRSAGYDDNRYYEITDLEEERQEWGDHWASLESPSSIESASWEIPVTEPLLTSNLLNPGDILVIYGSFNGVPWGHCGIVQSIQYRNDRNVEPNLVKMLDSSGAVMYVRDSRSLLTLRTMAGAESWTIRRLKHN